ncbi:hypothetical protein F443_13143 [Phytophthora nicotianae P1569]|uniref:Uncharacterized protein n=2 Tax=Phytophthora nicotianae TaxID=4792 RepID=V9ET07_PHYNI|nr:hypothetical protein F443_13143 [Phytophthora nicotianae P1569]ETO59913.1 hypothetical protein F444_21818 [Phytophthora nicotianae P1976]
MTRGRKRAPGGRGRQPSSYQREVDSYAKRLEVITFHDTNGMPATLDKFYDHQSAKKQENKRKRIYEWIKDRSRIESVCTSSTKASMKVLRGAGTATTISAAVTA